MQITRARIIDFEEGNKEVYPVEVPEGAKLLKIKVLHDGLYGWYEFSELVTTTQIDKFHIAKTGINLPADITFIDIVDSVIETQDKGQGVMMFPVYKFNS